MKGLKSINWWLVAVIFIVVVIGSAISQLLVDEETMIVKDPETGQISTITIDREIKKFWKKD